MSSQLDRHLPGPVELGARRASSPSSRWAIPDRPLGEHPLTRSARPRRSAAARSQRRRRIALHAEHEVLGASSRHSPHRRRAYVTTIELDRSWHHGRVNAWTDGATPRLRRSARSVRAGVRSAGASRSAPTATGARSSCDPTRSCSRSTRTRTVRRGLRGDRGPRARPHRRAAAAAQRTASPRARTDEPGSVPAAAVRTRHVSELVRHYRDDGFRVRPNHVYLATTGSWATRASSATPASPATPGVVGNPGVIGNPTCARLQRPPGPGAARPRRAACVSIGVRARDPRARHRPAHASPAGRGRRAPRPGRLRGSTPDWLDAQAVRRRGTTRTSPTTTGTVASTSRPGTARSSAASSASSAPTPSSTTAASCRASVTATTSPSSPPSSGPSAAGRRRHRRDVLRRLQRQRRAAADGGHDRPLLGDAASSSRRPATTGRAGRTSRPRCPTSSRSAASTAAAGRVLQLGAVGRRLCPGRRRRQHVLHRLRRPGRRGPRDRQPVTAAGPRGAAPASPPRRSPASSPRRCTSTAARPARPGTACELQQYRRPDLGQVFNV